MGNKSYIWSLPLQHPLLAVFAKDDILSAGKDVRSGGMLKAEHFSLQPSAFRDMRNFLGGSFDTAIHLLLAMQRGLQDS